MTTGDEPQLGGQALDNAHGDNSPMISGRGTRIIVSARGAYVAGNLRALIEMMNDEQRWLFRLALLRQLLAAGRENLTLVRSWRSNPAYRLEACAILERACGIANEWLLHPSLANSQPLYEPLISDGSIDTVASTSLTKDGIDGNLFELLLSILYCMGHVSLFVEPSRTLADIALWDNYAIAKTIQQRWRVEAAWQILNRREPPSFTNFVAPGILGEYRSGNITALIGRMNLDQQESFRKALKRSLIYCLPQKKIPEHITPVWNTLAIAAISQLDQPNQENIVKVKTTAAQVKSMIKPRSITNPFGHDPRVGNKWEQKWLIETVELVQIAIGDNFVESARAIQQLIRQCKPIVTDTDFELDPGWWVVEAAWAILHNESIQPFEYNEQSAD